MDTPDVTTQPVILFHCWQCRQPFPADALVIFTAALPEDLWPVPAEEGHYQAKVGLAYLCRTCTREGLALTNDDVHTALYAPLTGKDSADAFLSTPDPAHADSI